MTFPAIPLKRLCVEPPEYGLNVPADKYLPAGVRLVRTSDIADGGALRQDAPVFVDPDLATGRRLAPGDLLLSRSGTLGRALLWSSHHGSATFAGYLVRFSLDPRRVDPRFVWYAIQSTPLQNVIHLEATQSTIANFNANRYGNLRIPSPGLEEQRRIADFLDGEDLVLTALRDGKRRLLTLLSERRSRVALAAVSGELTSPSADRTGSDLTWLPTRPIHWKTVKLSLVARLGTGHTPDRSESKYWEAERDIPWLTTGDIERFRDDRLEILAETKESISGLGLENSAAVLHPAGTVALSRTASVGFSVIMGRDMATSQDFATWTCSGRLEPHFLLLCLRAMRPDLLGRLATGSTHRTIYMPEIQSLRIPLPPVEEQRRAVELAHEAMERIDALAGLIERQIPLLRERRETLVTAAVAGELDPSSYRASPVTA